MSDCVFCSIIAGDIPSTRVYEDDLCVAFLDIHPVTPGHTLVVPKAHSPSFLETDDAAISAIAPQLKRVAQACVKGVDAHGCTVSTNNGLAAGQSVFHLHWHIIPRKTDDGLTLWPQQQYAPGQAGTIAEKIKAELV